MRTHLKTTLIVALALAPMGPTAAFAADSVMTTESPARAPQRDLKVKSSKVPSYPIHQAKGKIPRLNIGSEAVLRFDEKNLPSTDGGDPVKIPPRATLTVSPVVEIPKNFQLPPLSQAVPIKTPAAAQPLPEFAPIPGAVITATEIKVRPVKSLTPDEVRLMEAQILHEKLGHADIALGLLAPLMKKSAVAGSASAAYAMAAKDLGLTSEFRSILMKMAQGSNKVAAKAALEQLVNHAQALEVPDIAIVQKLVESYNIDTDGKDAYNFLRAKHFLEVGDLTQVTEALEQVPDKSKFRADSLLVSALMLYRSNRLEQAIQNLNELLSLSNLEPAVESLGAITLGRIQFQKGNYDLATKAYLRVSKESPLWLQAMTERAWLQILTKDYEGAAGNMFSLHTDFFKNAFAPDSYTVRSVAYLNLCQFGDGYQVLKNLSRRYGPLVGRIEKYQADNKGEDAVFDTVRQWLKDPSQRDVQGLPRFFIVELARHPSYVRPQSRINRLEDEKEAFAKASLSLIQKEKDFLKWQSDFKAEQAKLQERSNNKTAATADTHLRIENLSKQIAIIKAQYELAKTARNQIKEAREAGIARIDLEKKELKTVAAKALKARLAVLDKELTQTLDQNEVLQYEILSGAGEHLRAQSAGAQAGSTDTKEKRDTSKGMTWKFQGEIWEDEVGHYRSSLKSVCTQNDQSTTH